MMAKNSAKTKNEEKIGRKRQKEESTSKRGIREKFTEMLELPKELILNTPRMTMVGNRDIMIENHKGIMEFDCERVRVNTGSGIVKITGSGLLIKEITSEDIIISGSIISIEFPNAG
jgi:sporulation protein YqfC